MIRTFNELIAKVNEVADREDKFYAVVGLLNHCRKNADFVKSYPKLLQAVQEKLVEFFFVYRSPPVAYAYFETFFADGKELADHLSESMDGWLPGLPMGMMNT